MFVSVRCRHGVLCWVRCVRVAYAKPSVAATTFFVDVDHSMLRAGKCTGSVVGQGRSGLLAPCWLSPLGVHGFDVTVHVQRDVPACMAAASTIKNNERSI